MYFFFKTSSGRKRFICEDTFNAEIYYANLYAYFDGQFPYYDSGLTPIYYLDNVLQLMFGTQSIDNLLPPKKIRCAMKAITRFERSCKDWRRASCLAYHECIPFMNKIGNCSQEELQVFLDMTGPDHDTALGAAVCLVPICCRHREVTSDRHFQAARIFWKKFPEYFFELMRTDDLLEQILAECDPARLKIFIQDALEYNPDYFKKWHDDFGNNPLHYFLLNAGLRRYSTLPTHIVDPCAGYTEPDPDEVLKEFVINRTMQGGDDFSPDGEEVYSLLVEKAGLDPESPDMGGISCSDLRSILHAHYSERGWKIQRKGELLLYADFQNEDYELEFMELQSGRRASRKNKERRRSSFMPGKHRRTGRARRTRK